MKITVSAARPAEVSADALVCALAEKPKALTQPLTALDRALDGLISGAVGAGELTGKRNTTAAFHTGGRLAARKLVCVGLGPAGQVTLEHARQAAAIAAKAAREQGARSLAVVATSFKVRGAKPAELAGALAEAILLSQYRFDRFKTASGNAKGIAVATLIVPAAQLDEARRAARRAVVVAQAVVAARDLVNLPGNELTPESLAGAARAVARKGGLSCRVLSGKALETNKLAGVLAVGAGSSNRPRFIILEYRPARSQGRPLVLIGKGVTFDSGGLSLKPSKSMEDMKTDMGGAAAVINAMSVVAALKPKFPVIALVPAVENMPGGSAARPGDIIRYASSKTVEIVNTDAEGRLVLADALVWAGRYKPAAVIDMATLTGACVIALGEHATGLFSTHSELARRITSSGDATFERVWELPLWSEYRPQIDSDVADVKNVGGRPAATITAALFLKEFVQGYPWAHLDIAATATVTKQRPYAATGATGIGVRLFAHLIANWAGPLE